MSPTDPDGTPPVGYATGRATKESIVQSAMTAFSQKGFYGASLRSIAREAGVDHSTLLHHFGNKTRLLLAVIEWHDLQNMPTELPASITPQYIAEAFVSTAERNRSVPGLVQLLSILAAEAGSDDHPARSEMQRRHDSITGLLAWAIKRRRASGEPWQDHLGPEDRAAFIVATWDGMQVYDALHPGQLDVPDILSRMLHEALGFDGSGDSDHG